MEQYIIVFDFDGVLANNSSLFINVFSELKLLRSRGYVLCLASFNFDAYRILDLNHVAALFSAWRCGFEKQTFASSWPEQNEFQNQDYITKELQIKSMIDELIQKQILDPNSTIKAIFFDDDEINICETLFSKIISCWPIQINPFHGIPDNLLDKIAEVMINWDFNLADNLVKWKKVSDSVALSDYYW